MENPKLKQTDNANQRPQNYRHNYSDKDEPHNALEGRNPVGKVRHILRGHINDPEMSHAGVGVTTVNAGNEALSAMAPEN